MEVYSEKADSFWYRRWRLRSRFSPHYGACGRSADARVGQNAPSFTLPSQEGTPISLDSYHGKWVVLYFYPKDMTQGCTIEAHNFQRDLAKFDAQML